MSDTYLPDRAREVVEEMVDGKEARRHGGIVGEREFLGEVRAIEGFARARRNEARARAQRAELVNVEHEARGFVAAMRRAAEEGGWGRMSAEKLARCADYIEDALPLNTRADAERLALRLRELGFNPSWERENGLPPA